MEKSNYKIFGEEIIDPKAIEQMDDAMVQPFAVRGALMPDAHFGYSLPIGGVVAAKDVLVPSWVGYDIGCGMCAVPTTFSAEKVKLWQDGIFDQVYKKVPVGYHHHKIPVVGDNCFDVNEHDTSEWFKEMYKVKGGQYQLGTLGGGNHFIEIGKGRDDRVWIVVHSGSRNVGHSTAAYYMALAANSDKPKEGHFPLHVGSFECDLYEKDMNFCLAFALRNRKSILIQTAAAIREYVPGHIIATERINRNHNHAEFNTNLGLWIHRKGATHAEKGMLGVIPGDMHAGSYIVEGRGNNDSLFSSSHGAGRELGRKEAERVLDVEAFKALMEGIKAKVGRSTLDEAPMAYKSINRVMSFQADLVKVVDHIDPIINVKG